MHLLLPSTNRENIGFLTYLISVKNIEANDTRGVENTDFSVFFLPFFCLWLRQTRSLPPSMGLWLIAAVRNNNRGNGGVPLWRTAAWLRGYGVSACDVLVGPLLPRRQGDRDTLCFETSSWVLISFSLTMASLLSTPIALLLKPSLTPSTLC